MVLVGIGAGLSFPSIMTLAMTGVKPEEAGLASGLVNTTLQVGGALGLAVLATLSTSRTANLVGGGDSAASALTSGYRLAFLIAAGLLLAASRSPLAVLVLASRRPQPTRRERAVAAGTRPSPLFSLRGRSRTADTDRVRLRRPRAARGRRRWPWCGAPRRAGWSGIAVVVVAVDADAAQGPRRSIAARTSASGWWRWRCSSGGIVGPVAVASGSTSKSASADLAGLASAAGAAVPDHPPAVRLDLDVVRRRSRGRSVSVLDVEDQQPLGGRFAAIPLRASSSSRRRVQVVDRVVEAADQVEAAEDRQLAHVGDLDRTSSPTFPAPARPSRPRCRRRSPPNRLEQRHEALAGAAGDVEQLSPA